MQKKTYQYQIRETDFNQWKMLLQRANELYAEFGIPPSQKGMRRVGDQLQIEETIMYPDEVDPDIVSDAMADDPRIQNLLGRFMDLVQGTVTEKPPLPQTAKGENLGPTV